MYVPKHFAVDNPAHLRELMERYNFAILFSLVNGEPYATHLPVWPREEQGQLYIDGHVAKANDHWRALEAGGTALLVFQGPHAYISPGNYLSNRRVPTWNYLAVHASGPVAVTHDSGEKHTILERLMAAHEPSFAAHFATFEQNLVDGFMNAIVGLTMTVTKLEGKFKLNQHRLADDRPELHAEFRAGDENHRALAEWMEKLGYWPKP